MDSIDKQKQMNEFTSGLPINLQHDLGKEIHKTQFVKFDLFSSIGNKSFLTWIGQNLKPLYVQQDQMCY